MDMKNQLEKEKNDMKNQLEREKAEIEKQKLDLQLTLETQINQRDTTIKCKHQCLIYI